MSDYLATNRQQWNARTAIHLASKFYDVPAFLAGATSLREIELGLLGDIAGQSLLHLQCHFGQDTLSLARLGAQVTGVDLSDVAIAAARTLAEQAELPARFIEADVYDLPNRLDEQFDVVFTTYGVLGWLPDMERWAQVVAHFLRPGGRLVLVEFHPVVWMLSPDFSAVSGHYFNRGPIHELEETTYTDGAPLSTALTSVNWDHSLGDVLGSLLRAGLRIDAFEEYDYSPYDCFSPVTQVAPQRYRISHLEDRIPMVYAVVASQQG